MDQKLSLMQHTHSLTELRFCHWGRTSMKGMDHWMEQLWSFDFDSGLSKHPSVVPRRTGSLAPGASMEAWTTCRTRRISRLFRGRSRLRRAPSPRRPSKLTRP
jgi:hypothetical protein